MIARRTRVIALCLAALALVGSAGQARAGELRNREIYEKAIRTAAWVRVPRGGGSGWVVDRAARLLVTNHHVVGSHDTVDVYFPAYRDGKVVTEKEYYLKKERPVVGKVIDSDPARDLAVIQVASLPATVAELKLAGEGVEPGDRLFSVGNPGASDALWVFSTGTVRAVYPKKMRYAFTGQEVKAWVIEMQTPINPGDSGGPIVNRRGELVGVNAAGRLSATLLTYGIERREVLAYVPLVRKLLSPVTAADFAGRGEHHAGRGRHDRAMADFDEAIRRDPRHAAAYYHRGLVRHRWGEHEQAAADFSKAIELDPKGAGAYLARGSALERLGRLDQAVADFDTALRLDPTSREARYRRGLVLHAKGEFDQALADFGEVLRLAPRDAAARKARGATLTAKGEYDKAIADLSQAIRLSPRDREAYLLRCKAYARKGDYPKAHADHKKAEELKAQWPFPPFSPPFADC
jgi:Flp pilus assembly protein TadD